MTDYKSTIAELRYLADWAKHHLDKAKIANDAAEAIEALQSKLDTATQSSAHWQHQCTELQAENERLMGVDRDAKLSAVMFRENRTAWESERDALQSKLGDAIRSLANWQHQCTELQAENERNQTVIKSWLKANGPDGWIDDLRKERNALQSRLDAMGKGEAVTDSYVQPVPDKCDRIVWQGRYYHLPIAAPKALAPLTQVQVVEGFCNTPHQVQYVAVFDAGVRFAEATHGIHAKGGQHEDA